MSALINRIVFQAVDVRQMARAWLDDGLTGLPLVKLSPDETIAMDLRVQEMQEGPPRQSWISARREEQQAAPSHELGRIQCSAG